MLRRTAFIVGTILLYPGISGAEAEGIIVKSPVDCALWADARKRPAPSAIALEHYVTGLVNGLALGSGTEFWRAKSGISKEQVYYYIDTYCQKNPLEGVLSGVIAVINEQTNNAYSRRVNAQPD